MGKTIVSEVTQDRQTNQLQANTAAATQQLRDGPFGNGNLVKGITFKGGDHQIVNHGLGRTVQGFVIVDQLYTGNSIGGVIVRSTLHSVDATKQIDLYCGDGPTIAAIWFY